MDVIAETRALFAPLVKSATVQIEDGPLQLGFVDEANHCKVDALEIVPQR